MYYVDDEGIKKEAKFLMKLNHPNVVQVKGICLSEMHHDGVNDFGLEVIWIDCTS